MKIEIDIILTKVQIDFLFKVDEEELYEPQSESMEENEIIEVLLDEGLIETILGESYYLTVLGHKFIEKLHSL